jgi:segregation and condensation protein B
MGETELGMCESELIAPPPDRGLSLDDLNAAFAEMLSGGDDPYTLPQPEADETGAAGQDVLDGGPLVDADEHDACCEVTPRTILEAMLFVGAADNGPLTSQRVSSMMRGVRPAEIDDLVRDLNERYDADGRPYRIESDVEGYRLRLRDEFAPIRDKLLGRTRQAKLSPAAIEILSIIAYNGPQTADHLAQLRGRPSGAILSQLVRRELLRIERNPESRRLTRYHTTPRFLALLGIETLDDLPHSQDVAPG